MIFQQTEKGREERIRDLLVTNKNLPNPGVMTYKIGSQDVILSKQPGRKIVFDEKGHPINPSNQRKYWKMVRKARRLNNSG